MHSPAGNSGHSLRQSPTAAAASAASPDEPRRQSADIAPRPWAALFSDEESAAFLNMSVRKFHGLRDEPWMPAPVVLGPRMVRWSRAELEAAIANMPRSRPAEPHQLLRARVERLKSTGVSA